MVRKNKGLLKHVCEVADNVRCSHCFVQAGFILKNTAINLKSVLKNAVKMITALSEMRSSHSHLFLSAMKWRATIKASSYIQKYGGCQKKRI